MDTITVYDVGIDKVVAQENILLRLGGYAHEDEFSETVSHAEAGPLLAPASISGVDHTLLTCLRAVPENWEIYK